MRNAPTNSDNIIDSRDVIERIGELESERDAAKESAVEVQEAIDALDAIADRDTAQDDELTALRARLWTSEHDDSNVYDDTCTYDESDDDELHALLELQNECEGYSDWRHGATLINESYFEDYARELAEDVHGRAIRDAQWPFDCIDWSQAAEALQSDYTTVDFAGTTFYIR